MSEPRDDLGPKVRVVDPLVSVRNHPEWFFRNGSFTVLEMLSRLTSEALAHGSTDVSVTEAGEWWIVASRTDWLGGDVRTFFSLTPDPQRGRNASRVEIALTAFCPAVVTAVHGDRHDVVTSARTPLPENTVVDDASWGRVVAFLPPRSGAEMDEHAASASSVPDLQVDLDRMLVELPGKLDELLGRSSR